MFLILFRNILCLQQMFRSLRSPRNIMSNNVSETMCPRLPVRLSPYYEVIKFKLELGAEALNIQFRRQLSASIIFKSLINWET